MILKKNYSLTVLEARNPKSRSRFFLQVRGDTSLPAPALAVILGVILGLWQHHSNLYCHVHVAIFPLCLYLHMVFCSVCLCV